MFEHLAIADSVLLRKTGDGGYVADPNSAMRFAANPNTGSMNSIGSGVNGFRASLAAWRRCRLVSRQQFVAAVLRYQHLSIGRIALNLLAQAVDMRLQRMRRDA